MAFDAGKELPLQERLDSLQETLVKVRLENRELRRRLNTMRRVLERPFPKATAEDLKRYQEERAWREK